MGNLEHALSAYEHALRHNSHSLPGLTQVAGIARIKENYPKVRVSPNSIQRRLHGCHLTSLAIIAPMPSLCSDRQTLISLPRSHRLSSTSRPHSRCRVTTAKCGPRSVRPTPIFSRSPASQTPPSGHCYLMQDDLQKAYAAYQQALYFLPNPKVRASPLRPSCHVAHAPLPPLD